MTSKKLGALIRSVPPATATEIADVPPAAALSASILAAEPATSVPAAFPPQVAFQPLPVPVTKSAPQGEVALQVMVPVAVRRQLALMSAEQGESLRSLILQAVRSLGIEVDDQEIKNRRPRRA